MGHPPVGTFQLREQRIRKSAFSPRHSPFLEWWEGARVDYANCGGMISSRLKRSWWRFLLHGWKAESFVAWLVVRDFPKEARER